MNRQVALGILTLAPAAVAGAGLARGQDAPPAWAYVVNPPGFKPPADDGRLRRVPDSTGARGRKPDVFACG